MKFPKSIYVFFYKFLLKLIIFFIEIIKKSRLFRFIQKFLIRSNLNSFEKNLRYLF